MSAVPLHEVIAALRGPIGALGNAQRKELADRIEQNGIAPPDGRTPVAWAIDMPYGRAYSFADEVIGKWIVEIDANGCSTHPKARHGFARQASDSEGEYVCECAGFDPYDAGYQDGIRAAWDANGTLLPDGMVLVKDKPVCWSITGGGKFDLIEFGKTWEFSSESLGYWIGRGYNAIPLYATAPEEMESPNE